MKLFLVTTGTKDSLEALDKAKHKNILISYFYLRNSKPEAIQEFFDWCEERDICLFMDSGTFSIRTDKKLVEMLSHMTLDKMMDFYKDYARGYLKLVEQYYDQIYCFAELDIDTVIGYDKVLELRKLIPKHLLPKFTPVYHFDTRSVQDFKDDCDFVKYMAIGTDEKSDERTKNISVFAKHARKKDIKMHGFAMIDVKLLKKVPLTSADSSTWLNGVRFGLLFYFDKATCSLKSFSYNDTETAMKRLHHYTKNNPDFMKIWSKDGEPKKISNTYRITLNAKAYHELETHLTKLWEMRGIT